MTPVDDELSLDSPKSEALSGPRQIDQQAADVGPVSPPTTSDLEALTGLDCANTDMLRPALAALIEGGADRFDPVRIRFIQALAENAFRQRPSVALLVEKKALQALSGYLDDYRSAREHAASLVDHVAPKTPEAADEIRRLFECSDFRAVERLAARTAGHADNNPGTLVALTREMLQRNGGGESSASGALEDELRLQELQVMQSVSGVTQSKGDGAGGDLGPSGFDEPSAMHRFRQSLRQHHSKERVSRAIKDGPENPGPLNAQALVVRSLSIMRDLSPDYTNRLVSYMDTLLWLEQVGRAAERKKTKRAGRRRS